MEEDENGGLPVVEGGSSSKKTIGSHAIKSYVHDEYIQESYRDHSKKRSLQWTSKCKICNKKLAGKQPAILYGHLKAFHKETFNKVELLDFKNRQSMDDKVQVRVVNEIF